MGVIFFPTEVSEETTICNNRDRTHNSEINKKPKFEDLKAAEARIQHIKVSSEVWLCVASALAFAFEIPNRLWTPKRRESGVVSK